MKVAPAMVQATPENTRAFRQDDRAVTFQNFKVACLLGIVLMPAGVMLDYFVYEDHLAKFFALRILCSASIAMFLAIVLVTPVLREHHRGMGLLLAMLPPFFMSWMIFDTEGAKSPYYAGLTLVILITGFTLNWTAWESFLAVLAVVGMYIGTCLLHGSLSLSMDVELGGIFFNNMYFLVLTGVVVVIGSHFHHRLRFREFALRYASVQQNEKLEKTLNQLNATEVQLQQSEKLALLGELSAGIVHEINNPLNTARQGLYALRQKAAAVNGQGQAECQSIITLVEEGVQRVIGIVSNMRQFAYPEQGANEPVPVSEVVETAVRLLMSEWRKGEVKIKQSIPEGLTVWANRNGLTHVLINLLKNSLDALKEVPPEGRAPTVEIEAVAAGRRVLIHVRDNGPGIASEHQSRIFDILGMGDEGQSQVGSVGDGKVFRHFFTTKAPGVGMGMGLGICRRLIRAQNGKISFRSQPGVLCEFTLDLRAADSMKATA